jgi:hypothetical protein
MYYDEDCCIEATIYISEKQHDSVVLGLVIEDIARLESSERHSY